MTEDLKSNREDHLGENLKNLEYHISQELKKSKQASSEHIYGQLPNRLTPSEAKTILVVLLLIAVFAAVMVFGSIFTGG